MSAVSVVAATVRPVRTVVLRRALLAVLFLGGFLFLGFVFGGSAQAAARDGLSLPDGGRTSSSERTFDADGADTLRQRAKEGAAASFERSAEAADETSEKTSDKTSETRSRVTETVTRQALRPVEDGVRYVTDPVGDMVRDTTGALPVRLPGTGLVTGEDGILDAHELAGRQSAGAGASADDTAVAHRRTGIAGNDFLAWTAAWPQPATGCAGADDERVAPVAQAAADNGLSGHHAPFQAPFPQAPSGMAPQYTGDNGVPRGGEHHAALPPAGSARFGLVPGAVAADSSAPTRERFNEVLEFPG